MVILIKKALFLIVALYAYCALSVPIERCPAAALRRLLRQHSERHQRLALLQLHHFPPHQGSRMAAQVRRPACQQLPEIPDGRQVRIHRLVLRCTSLLLFSQPFPQVRLFAFLLCLS